MEVPTPAPAAQQPGEPSSQGEEHSPAGARATEGSQSQAGDTLT